MAGYMCALSFIFKVTTRPNETDTAFVIHTKLFHLVIQLFYGELNFSSVPIILYVYFFSKLYVSNNCR